jgi:hypothetical protein
MLDGVVWSEVPSETGKYRLFQQRDDGFTSVGSCGRRYGGLFEVKATISHRSLAPRRAKWQERRIIPAQA